MERETPQEAAAEGSASDPWMFSGILLQSRGVGQAGGCAGSGFQLGWHCFASSPAESSLVD